MAFLPKGALESKRTAQLAVAASVIGLVVVPVLTVPAMFLGGITWSGAPRWARMTLIIGAVVFVAYFVAFKPAGQVPHHR
jgi:protein-S-isoprenylcysteine O-methyltransferase Ste14